MIYQIDRSNKGEVSRKGKRINLILDYWSKYDIIDFENSRT